MKNASLVFSTLAFIGVLILFGLHFSGNKRTGGADHSGTSSAKVAGPGRIAFVDIDSLEANYVFLKNKKADFEKRQVAMKAELQNSAQQLQRNVADVQRQAQAGTLTQPQYEAAEKRIGQMQQSLQAREAALTEQLLKEQDEFNKDLQSRLDAYLRKYNQDKNYDYILSYTRSGSILYADKGLDITKDVIDGMNNLAAKGDTTTRKK